MLFPKITHFYTYLHSLTTPQQLNAAVQLLRVGQMGHGDVHAFDADDMPRAIRALQNRGQALGHVCSGSGQWRKVTPKYV